MRSPLMKRSECSIRLLCPGCGYNLNGLGSNACPECGRWFSEYDLQLVSQLRRRLVWRSCLHTAVLSIALITAVGAFAMLSAAIAAWFALGAIALNIAAGSLSTLTLLPVHGVPRPLIWLANMSWLHLPWMIAVIPGSCAHLIALISFAPALALWAMRFVDTIALVQDYTGIEMTSSRCGVIFPIVAAVVSLASAIALAALVSLIIMAP